MGSSLAHLLQKLQLCAGEEKKPARDLALLVLGAFGNSANNGGRITDNDRFEGHEKRKLCGRTAREA